MNLSILGSGLFLSMLLVTSIIAWIGVHIDARNLKKFSEDVANFKFP